jgi:crotonobetainyl-CoA:carnitine CoA-transferase CaiB-like acyl-CoA transferase
MSTRGLLADVRVIDLTDAYGAFATRLLADLGAEVVRIERPGGGTGRSKPPHAGDGTSLHHVHRNVGKSVLETADPAVIHGLLAGADLAFCSGSTAAGSPEEMLTRHPHLVVISVSPFGRTGSTADWKATELVAQALAGVVYRSGVAELPPVSAPGSYCEDVGSVLAAFAGMLGLWQQREGGTGQVIDTSSILALAQCTEMSLPLWSLLKYEQARAGAGLYPLFECTDGLARIVLPMSPAEWRSLIAWLGSPPEWTGQEWEQAMLGPAERDQILARLPERFAAGTREQLAAEGDVAGLRITPVLTPAEVLSNEHVIARGSFADVQVGARVGKLPAPLLGVNGERTPAGAAAHTIADPPSWEARPAHAEPAGHPALPLLGIRVLEIGSGVAAPEAGRVLSEWGADVIKIESRRRPDFQRMVMGGDMNPAFSTPNRNKRAFAADLSTPAGRQLVHQLLPQIDVIIENNASGVIERLGLGWETVSAINPRIVMVNTQLYGDRGPWASKKGYGPSARAIGGLTWLWAHGPDAPRGVMTIHPDHVAGRLVALGALAALHDRRRTGLGSRVDLAQFEALSALLGDIFLAESLQPGAAVPLGNGSTEHAPWNLFRCADDAVGAERWLAVCVPDDDTWSALVAAAPIDLARPEWTTEAGRLADSARLESEVANWLRSADAVVVEALLQGAGVPAGQALFPRIQVEHPHFASYPVALEQPGLGSLLVEGPAFTATRMGTPRCDPAPALGQHTAEICRDLLGVDAGDLAALIESGAIDPPPAAA